MKRHFDFSLAFRTGLVLRLPLSLDAAAVRAVAMPRLIAPNAHLALIESRTAAGLDALRRGATGWARTNGRDERPILKKVAFDTDHVVKRAFVFDLRILLMIALQLIKRDDVAH